MLPRSLRLERINLKNQQIRKKFFYSSLELREINAEDIHNKWLVRVPKTIISSAHDRNRIRRLLHEAIMREAQKERRACFEIIIRKPVPEWTVVQAREALAKLLQMAQKA